MKHTIHEPSFSSALIQGDLRDIQSKVYNTVYTSGLVSDDFSSTNFYECMFKGVSFKGNMKGCLFQDVIFERCDLSNCDFSECVFRRVTFDTCRMMGTDASSSSFILFFITASALMSISMVQNGKMQGWKELFCAKGQFP